MPARRLIVLLMVGWVAGCAVSPQGRLRVTAPDDVSAAYSEIELQTSLAIASRSDCLDADCLRSAAFKEQLQRVGERLAAAAATAYPERMGQGLRFEFSVAPRGEFGTLSNAAGRIVLLDGIAATGIDDAALAFIVAREMGHVIERHHDENSALSILASIAVHLVLPIANLIPSGSMTSMGLSGAASFAGSQALKKATRPDQRDEADAVALLLLSRAGWEFDEVARALEVRMPRLASGDAEGWLADFHVSKLRLDQFGCGNFLPPAQDVLVTAFETPQSLAE